jgi:hypothetical protein
MKMYIYIIVSMKHFIGAGTAMGYGLDGRVSIPAKGKRFFSIPQCPDRVWAPPSLSNGYRRLFPRG